MGRYYLIGLKYWYECVTKGYNGESHDLICRYHLWQERLIDRRFIERLIILNWFVACEALKVK